MKTVLNIPVNYILKAYKKTPSSINSKLDHAEYIMEHLLWQDKEFLGVTDDGFVLARFNGEFEKLSMVEYLHRVHEFDIKPLLQKDDLKYQKNIKYLINSYNVGRTWENMLTDSILSAWTKEDMQKIILENGMELVY